MKKEGLEPAAFTASGHIHIEVSQISPVAFRNFLVDFYNHTGLGAGALYDDIFNSIGIGELPQPNKDELRRIIADFDQDPSASKQNLVSRIVNEAYDVEYSKESAEYRKIRSSRRASKYHTVSLESFHSLGTIEIRSIRPQGSATSYEKLLKLFVARMKIANELASGQKIALGKLKSLRGKPQAILKNFDDYVATQDSTEPSFFIVQSEIFIFQERPIKFLSHRQHSGSLLRPLQKFRRDLEDSLY